MTRILIAGMGNVLRRDDGFGVEVARRLAGRYAAPGEGSVASPGAASGPSPAPLPGLPTGAIRVIEVGIGGIHLVQELMKGYDILVIVDAVDRGSPPGSVHLLKPDVPDLGSWPEAERGDFLADMHYATPSKALILARALGILPPKVFIVGCQPVDGTEMGIGLSEPVQAGVQRAIEQMDELIARMAPGVL